ncbi:MAG: proline--tRNA ligase [Euryarchaeota archaeon]|nr:proline--tRNA ligase [Euryarchaeota archaeon]
MLSEDEFSEWYNDIVEKAGLCDKRYPVKGMNIWTPYGWKLMSLIDAVTHSEMARTGHREVCFPLLIPEDQFAKEEKHIKGFGGEVYWVTHAGLNPLDIRLLLRPTSETAMYPIFALWIRAHTDLPFKVYQICNVFRYETKQTRAFVRVREIHFFEAHTCHADFEDAERQIREDLEIMSVVGKSLCLPYMEMRRPDWDKFAGAHYSVGIDVFMPTGRTIQIGGIHQYRENFAKAYGITYEDEKGEHRLAHQTTYGMSERLVGAVVAVHHDQKGLKFPPAVAPIQVVIVPIPAKELQEKVAQECRTVFHRLQSNGIRAHLDERDLRPGNKFYDWEEKGVPLRLELGKRDLANNAAVLVRRDNGAKVSVPRDELIMIVKRILDEIGISMLKAAEEQLKAGIRDVEALDDLPVGVIRMRWCAEEACGKDAEARTGLNILGTRYSGEQAEGKCAACWKPAKTYLYAARTY